MLALGCAVATVAAHRDAIQPIDAMPVGSRLATAVASTGAYLVDLAWPVGLVVFRPYAAPDATGVTAVVDAALAHYERAIALDPRYAEARCNRASALLRADRVVDAIAEYERTLAVKPQYAEADNNLAIAYARAGRADAALAPRVATILDNLADAYAGAGRCADAAAAGENALAAAAAAGDPRRVEDVRTAMARRARVCGVR